MDLKSIQYGFDSHRRHQGEPMTVSIIEPTYKILFLNKEPLKLIEQAARTCYKSEDKITNESALDLVQSLFNRGHHAMLEFGYAIVKFTTNRGASHELVRHRLASFAQESSRWVNYAKGKHNGDFLFVDPTAMLKMKIKDVSIRQSIYLEMVEAWINATNSYMKIVNMGAPPDIAREVLPIGLKTDIVIGANLREWMHIFKMRNSKKAHPRMRELMGPLRNDFQRRVPVLFD
jgi:thymidylate synthase (FAD)